MCQKGKAHPRTGHKDSGAEYSYSCTLSLTSALNVRERDPVPTFTGWEGPRVWKSPPLGFDPRTVRPVASRCILRLKCDGTRAETRFLLSAKRTSPFKSAGSLVQSTTGSRGVLISSSIGGYNMFRGSVRVLATNSIRHFPLHFPSRASPFFITFQLYSTACASLFYAVTWRILVTHSIVLFPLHFSSRTSPCAITFQLESSSYAVPVTNCCADDNCKPFYIYCSVHHNILLEITNRCSCMQWILFLCLVHSTCFGRHTRPSSGVQLYLQPLVQS